MDDVEIIVLPATSDFLFIGQPVSAFALINNTRARACILAKEVLRCGGNQAANIHMGFQGFGHQKAKNKQEAVVVC